MNIVEAWDVRDTDNLIRDLAQCVKRCMVPFERSAPIADGRDLLA
jgi:hypothetical protein